MNTSKMLVAGVAGGVVSFLGGYLIYGMAMKDFFAQHAGTEGNMMRTPETMIWWALALGCLLMGFAYAYILGKAGVNSLGRGLSVGFIVGLLITAGQDFIMLGSSTMGTQTSALADAVCGAVLGAAVGAVVGVVYGSGNKKAA